MPYSDNQLSHFLQPDKSFLLFVKRDGVIHVFLEDRCQICLILR